MAVVLAVDVAVVEVIDMVAMADGLVAAVRPMGVDSAPIAPATEISTWDDDAIERSSEDLIPATKPSLTELRSSRTFESSSFIVSGPIDFSSAR